MTHPRDQGYGCVRIHKRRAIACYVEGDRDAYEWSLDQAIATYSNEKIHAGWCYTDATGIREDRTRYAPETGRKEWVRCFPFLHAREQA